MFQFLIYSRLPELIMIGPNITLTLIVAAALVFLIWTHLPAAWTPMQSLGLS